MSMSLGKEKRSLPLINIVIIYPFALTLVAGLINWFVGVSPLEIAIPQENMWISLSLSGVLLVFNHSWLMTSTEIVREKFRLFATPEEQKNEGTLPENAAETGKIELERNHNAHRNATENITSFLMLCIPFSFCSPSNAIALLWPISFALGRMAHAYGYLTGSTAIRGLGMTVSLLAMYGISTYLILSYFI